MKYTKGKAGPVSRHEIEIVDVIHVGTGPSAYARGNVMLRKADGSLKGVGFMVQGGNYAALRDQLKPGERLRVPVRWTGAYAITIVDEKTLEAYRESQGNRKAA